MTTISTSCLDTYVRKQRVAVPWRRWCFRLAVVGLVLVVCELQLQLAAYCIPSVNRALLPPHLQASLAPTGPALLIPDALLGHRGNPTYPDHDRFGFRNKVVHEQPDIVTLGDSQTHGLTNAEATWPAALERTTNQTVYNMGIAGWGPVEYLRMLDAALQRKPKTILVGLYLGNDIADAYRSVVLRGACPELASEVSPRAFTERISEERWNAEISKLFRPPSHEPRPQGDGWTQQCRKMMSNHSRLYGLARAFKNTVAHQLDGIKSPQRREEESWARTIAWSNQRPQASVLEVDRLRTVLTPAYRDALIDPSDPRNQAGLGITLTALERMADRCQAQDVELIVAIIPTKEWVFNAVINDRDAHLQLADLMISEADVRREVVSTLDELRIRHIDTGSSLRKSVLGGQQPYPISTDGHPNAIGNEAIARAIADHLRSPS